MFSVTVIGNLTADPELKFTAAGAAVARFTVAHNPRKKDAEGNWADGEPTFVDCEAWRQLAENITESLVKGNRVIVTGRVRTDRWTDKTSGEKRSRQILDVEGVGPDLTWATAKVARIQGRPASTGPADDPWATATPADAFDPTH